jgi:hypothetical protein
MGELLARAFTEQALLDAWDEVRESALADGEAGPEVERFEAAAARRISALAEDLAAGTYQPSPVVRVEVAKSMEARGAWAFPFWSIGLWSVRCSVSWMRSLIRCCCRGVSPTGAVLAYGTPWRA